MFVLQLVPFPGEAVPRRLVVEATLARAGGIVSVAYRLCGNLSALRAPALSSEPTRRDGLWEATCLECFVGTYDRPFYLEVNLSPSGDWNVYRFGGPREGMAPLEPAGLTVLPRSEEGGVLGLGFTIALPTELASAPLEVGVAAVIQHGEPGGQAVRTTHYAAAHTADRPDFHRRSAWTLHV